jgi:cell division protein FtsL
MRDSFIARGDSPSTIRRAIDRRGLATFAAALSACALLGAGALAQAWIRTQVTQEGYRLSRLSSEHGQLLRERERLQFELGALSRPARIEELARTKLGMGPAPAERTVVVVAGALRPGAVLSALPFGPTGATALQR